MDIFKAIEFNHTTEIQQHIDSGTNLDAPNAKGVKPIVVALESALSTGNTSALRMLLEAGAKSEPLMNSIRQKLENLPLTLLKEHNSTAQAINDTIGKFKGKESQLTTDEKVRLKTYLESAGAFNEMSRSLRDRISSLSEAVSEHGEGVIEEVVSYFREVDHFSFKAMGLRIESVTLETLLT